MSTLPVSLLAYPITVSKKNAEKATHVLQTPPKQMVRVRQRQMPARTQKQQRQILCTLRGSTIIANRPCKYFLKLQRRKKKKKKKTGGFVRHNGSIRHASRIETQACRNVRISNRHYCRWVLRLIEWVIYNGGFRWVGLYGSFFIVG